MAKKPAASSLSEAPAPDAPLLADVRGVAIRQGAEVAAVYHGKLYVGQVVSYHSGTYSSAVSIKFGPGAPAEVRPENVVVLNTL